MTALAALKADQARIWGSASWHEIAERQLFPVHDELVARLEPQPRERWLDLATSTSKVTARRRASALRGHTCSFWVGGGSAKSQGA
jgi:hypothetical protein